MLVLCWFFMIFNATWRGELCRSAAGDDLLPLLVMSSDLLPNSRDSEDQKRENPWKSSERIYWICIINVYIYIEIYIYICRIAICSHAGTLMPKRKSLSRVESAGATKIYIYIWWLVKIQVLLLAVFIWFNQLHVDSRATGWAHGKSWSFQGSKCCTAAPRYVALWAMF